MVSVVVVTLGIALAVNSNGDDERPGKFSRWKDDTVHGPWRSVFDGHGLNGKRDDVISLRPQAAAGPDKTHAGLVVSRAVYGNVDYTVKTRTVETLRQPPANPWEVAWVVWAYTDDEHFYYVIPKPNGWELGKRDPAYPGGQRFLASGETQYPIGTWYTVHVKQDGPSLTVEVDGKKLTTFTDAERPYLNGSVGMYTEDAAVEFTDIKVSH